MEPKRIWKKLRTHLRGIPKIPLAILLVVIFAALFANFVAPHDPEMGDPKDRNLPPFWQARGTFEYPLGTDHVGRDVLSRLIFGARVSLIVAFMAVFVAGGLGTFIGIVSGYLGGKFDEILMRITDGWLAFPTMFTAVLMAMLLGPGLKNIVIVLGVVYWTRYARVIRGEVLSLRERDFVHLAITAGCGKLSIMWKHILPNVISTAVVLATLQLGLVIIMEASLTFIGVGVPSPKPAWGLMLSDGRDGMMAGYWWTSVFPGLAIVFLVMTANFLGDWLRVRLDPRLQQLL
jgi:peptide/nickel transport system permease protein